MDKDNVPEGKGWLCFHCGERCETAEDARIHFGIDEEWPAACTDPLRTDEKERQAAIVSLYQELEGERNEYGKLLAKMESKDYAWSADQDRAIKQAEEDGYNKGVADMTKQYNIKLEGGTHHDKTS